MRRSFVILLAVIALPASPAVAQECVAPPGTAAVEEYCETVPSAGGGRGTNGSGGSGSGTTPLAPPVPVPADTVEELSGSGEDGEQLAGALGGGDDGKKPGNGSDPLAGGGSGEANAEVPGTPDGSPLYAITRSVSEGATTGAAFGAALLFLTLAMAAWGWLGYRRRTHH